MHLFLSLEKDLDAVTAALSNSLAIYPRDPILRLVAAKVAMKQGDLATAYVHYKYCITYYNDLPFFWCGLGTLYYRSDQAQDAAVAFQRALYLKCDLPEAWLNIGLVLEQNGDYAAAEKVYHSGANECPESAQNEFKNRIDALNTQKMGHRKYAQSYNLAELDDAKFITPPPEQFACDYLSAVPLLPGSCYGDADVGKRFETLATFPKSLFA